MSEKKHYPLSTTGSFEQIMQMGQVLARSGLLPRGLDTPEKAVAALLAARDLGLGPAAVLAGDIYVTGSGVALTTRRMLAMIYASRLVDVEIRYDEERQAAIVTMRRRDIAVSYTATWDEEKVRLAGADIDPKTGQQKPAWKRYRWLMKIHRAVSEAAQFVAPDIIGQSYIPDELDLPEATVYNPIADTAVEVASEETAATEKAPDWHWIDDDATRRRFWAWCKSEMHLTEDEVHEALGVPSVHLFRGTKADAYNLIRDYADRKTELAEARRASANLVEE